MSMDSKQQIPTSKNWDHQSRGPQELSSPSVWRAKITPMTFNTVAFAVLGDNYVSILEIYVQQQPEIKKPAMKILCVPVMSTQRKI